MVLNQIELEKKFWKFNLTYNRLGKQRLIRNPRDSNLYSPAHFSINSQQQGFLAQNLRFTSRR